MNSQHHHRKEKSLPQNHYRQNRPPIIPPLHLTNSSELAKLDHHSSARQPNQQNIPQFIAPPLSSRNYEMRPMTLFQDSFNNNDNSRESFMRSRVSQFQVGGVSNNNHGGKSRQPRNKSIQSIRGGGAGANVQIVKTQGDEDFESLLKSSTNPMHRSSPLRYPKVLNDLAPPPSSSSSSRPQNQNNFIGRNNSSNNSVVINHSYGPQTPGRRSAGRSGQIVNISNIPFDSKLAESNTDLKFNEDLHRNIPDKTHPNEQTVTEKFPLMQIHNPPCNLNSLLQDSKQIELQRRNALMQFYSQRCMNITKQINECLQAAEYDPMIQILKNSSRNADQIKQRLRTVVNNKLAIQRQVQIDSLSRDLAIIQTINQKLEKELASVFDNADPSKLCISMKIRDLMKENDNLRDILRRQRGGGQPGDSQYRSPRNGTLSPSGSGRNLKSPTMSPTFQSKSNNNGLKSNMLQSTQADSNQIMLLKRDLAESDKEKQTLLNDVTASKSKANELQNQLFLSQQRTQQAGYKIQTLEVEIKTLRGRLKSMEVENNKGSSRMFSMENELIDSFKKEKQSYLKQIQGLHHKISDMNRVMDRIPQLEHKILVQQHTLKTHEKRGDSQLKEADEKMKTLIFSNQKKQLALNKTINERDNEISELKNEIGVIKKESQITLSGIKSDIDKNYLSKEQHINQVERQIRLCQEKNQNEFNNLLNKQQEATEKLLNQCQENYNSDREHISKEIKSKDQEMTKTLHIRDQLIESLQFEKKVVQRLQRDIDQINNERAIIQTKYDELKKHYENKRVQCDQYRKEIGDLKLDFRNKSEQNNSIRKDYQQIQNELFLKTNECGQRDAQLAQARADNHKLKQEKESLVREKFALVKEHSLQLLEKGNKNQIAVNKAEEHTSRVMKDLQGREHQLHTTLVKLNQAEQLIEQGKKEESQLSEQLHKMSKENENLLNKIAGLQNENTDLKRIVKGREMQLSTLQFNFTKFKKFFILQVQREIESMRYTFKVTRESINHEMVMMREQSQNLVRENVLNILSFQEQIKDKQTGAEMDVLADEWRGKYDQTVREMQKQIDIRMNNLNKAQQQLRSEKNKHESEVRKLQSLRMRTEQDNKCIDMERKSAQGRCARLNEDNAEIKVALQNKKLELLSQKQHYEQIIRQNERESKQQLRRVQNELGEELKLFKQDKQIKLKEMQDELARLKIQHQKERYQERKDMLQQNERSADNFKRIVRQKDAQIEDLNSRIRDLREQCDNRVGQSSNVIKTLTSNMKSERESAHKVSEKLQKELTQSRSTNHFLKLDLQRKTDQLERLCNQVKTTRDKSSKLNQTVFQLNKENTLLKSKISYREQSAKQQARVLNSILQNGKRRNFLNSDNRFESQQRKPGNFSLNIKELDSKKKDDDGKKSSDIKQQLANTFKQIEIKPLDKCSTEKKLEMSSKPDLHLKMTFPQTTSEKSEQDSKREFFGNQNELTFENHNNQDDKGNNKVETKKKNNNKEETGILSGSLNNLRTPTKQSWIPKQLSPSGGGGLDKNSQI